MKRTIRKRFSSGDRGLTRIEKAKDELEHLIDLNPRVMLLADRAGTVWRANRALLEMTGLTEIETVPGRNVREIFRCRDPELLRRAIRKRTGVVSVEGETDLPNGRSRLLEFTFVGSGAGDELLAIIVDDVSGRSKSAARVEKEHKKEAVRALMGGLMHSLNQPLTVISMRSHLMGLALEKGTVDAAEMKRSLRDIQNFAVEIGQMLQNVVEPKDFVTEAYVGGTSILDVERAGTHTAALRSACLAALEGVLAALDNRCPGVLAHARRTSDTAGRLATQAGLEESAVALAERAGLLHDIGKVGVPDEVLRKPEKLNVSETEVMRRHVEIGYEIVRAFPLLQDEAEVVRAHHEWYDGKGYPRGIGGKEIPTEARIVAVADAFDALRHSRSYRRAESAVEAATEIESDAGTHFDPDIVKLLAPCCAVGAKTDGAPSASPHRATHT